MSKVRQSGKVGWWWALACVLLSSGVVVGMVVRNLSPFLMNADVIMNSIMSLQNLTVFYWGQDRLLNLLPFLVSWVRDPAMNLQLVVVVPVVFLMLSLSLVTFAANEMLEGGSKEFLLTYLTLVSVFVVGLTGVGVFEIAVWHVEYTFPLIAVVFSVYCIFGRRLQSLPVFYFSLLVLFVATGVNPSSFILVLFVSVSSVVCCKRLRPRVVVLAVSSVASFVAWGVLGRLFGEGGDAPGRYSKLSFSRIYGGINALITSSIADVNYLGILVLFGALSCFFLSWRFWDKGRRARDATGWAVFDELLLVSLMLFFSAVWIVLFSANEWVERNQFHWRYFIWPYFAVVTSITLLFRRLVVSSNVVGYFCVSALVVLAVLSGFLTWPEGRGDISVLSRAKSDGVSVDGLYAGDYWRVWPAVMQGMLSGRIAYGVAFRWSGNGIVVQNHLRKILDTKGEAEILCLGVAGVECLQQMRTVVPNISVRNVLAKKDDVHLLTVVRSRPNSSIDGIEYAGKGLWELPSQVGRWSDEGIQADGRAGCLIYGPYVSLPSGSYRFVLNGSEANAETDVVKITAETGAKEIIKTPIGDAASGSLVDLDVELRAPIQAAEIAVCVGNTSKLKLTSYKLKKYTQN